MSGRYCALHYEERQAVIPASRFKFQARVPLFPMTGREYAELLREATAFFESHPDLPVPETYRTLAVLYENPDENAAKTLDVVKN